MWRRWHIRLKHERSGGPRGLQWRDHWRGLHLSFDETSQPACCCSLPVVVTLWPCCGRKSCDMRIIIRINQAKPQLCWFEFVRKLTAINIHSRHGSMNNNRIQLIWSFNGKNSQVTQLAGGAWLNSGKRTFCRDVLIYSNIIKQSWKAEGFPENEEKWSFNPFLWTNDRVQIAQL